MKVQQLFVAVAFAFLCACAPKVEVTDSRTAVAETAARAASDSADAADIASCAARGGMVDTVGRMQRRLCRIPFADAGRTCSNKSDCAGRCIYDHEESGDEPSGAVTGQCQQYATQFGCYSEVDGGEIKSTICVD
jgi:hypothetical protein